MVILDAPVSSPAPEAVAPAPSLPRRPDDGAVERLLEALQWTVLNIDRTALPDGGSLALALGVARRLAATRHRALTVSPRRACGRRDRTRPRPPRPRSRP